MRNQPVHDHWGEEAELKETVLPRIALETRREEGCDCRQKVALYTQTGILCHMKSLTSVAATCAFGHETGCSLHGTGEPSSRAMLLQGQGKADKRREIWEPMCTFILTRGTHQGARGQ